MNEELWIPFNFFSVKSDIREVICFDKDLLTSDVFFIRVPRRIPEC